MAAGSLRLDDQTLVPASIYDLDGFRRWAHSADFPDRGQFSYLSGEVCADMSPEDLQKHNKLKRVLTSYLGLWVDSRDLGDVLADGALFTNSEADLSTEPDFMFIRWDSLETGRVQYVEWSEGSDRYVEVAGAPDLVVEIVSHSSVYKDTERLPSLYFAAGVAEYWLIDARGGEIDFQLKTRGAEGWINAVPDADGYRRSGVLGGAFRLVRELNRVGGFRYDLLSKSE